MPGRPQQWSVKPKGSAEYIFHAEQSITKFKVLICARKKCLLSVPHICSLGQRPPNAVSNLIPSYHRHYVFLVQPCNNPSPTDAAGP